MKAWSQAHQPRLSDHVARVRYDGDAARAEGWIALPSGSLGGSHSRLLARPIDCSCQPYELGLDVFRAAGQVYCMKHKPFASVLYRHCPVVTLADSTTVNEDTFRQIHRGRIREQLVVVTAASARISA